MRSSGLLWIHVHKKSLTKRARLNAQIVLKRIKIKNYTFFVWQNYASRGYQKIPIKRYFLKISGYFLHLNLKSVILALTFNG